MIDQTARDRYFREQSQKSLLQDTTASISATTKEMITSLQQDTQQTRKAVLEEGRKQQQFSDKLGRAMLLVYEKIPQMIKLPSIFPIKGDVAVTELPPVSIDNFKQLGIYFTSLEEKISEFTKQVLAGRKMENTKPIELKVNNLTDLKTYFASLEKRIGELATAVSNVPAPKIAFPKIEIPPAQTASLDPKVLELMDSLHEKINRTSAVPKVEKNQSEGQLLALLRVLNEKVTKIMSPEPFPKTVSIDNFPIQLTPQPVTNININPLQGFVKTTASTVGTTVTQLPSYGQLFNRRAVQIYNNSNNTIYIGGSDVTVANGIPVPANSYSNIIDAGYNMLVYGISSQVGNNVRVLEVSKDKTGTVQE